MRVETPFQRGQLASRLHSQKSTMRSDKHNPHSMHAARTTGVARPTGNSMHSNHATKIIGIKTALEKAFPSTPHAAVPQLEVANLKDIHGLLTSFQEIAQAKTDAGIALPEHLDAISKFDLAAHIDGNGTFVSGKGVDDLTDVHTALTAAVTHYNDSTKKPNPGFLDFLDGLKDKSDKEIQTAFEADANKGHLSILKGMLADQKSDLYKLIPSAIKPPGDTGAKPDPTAGMTEAEVDKLIAAKLGFHNSVWFAALAALLPTGLAVWALVQLNAAQQAIQKLNTSSAQQLTQIKQALAAVYTQLQQSIDTLGSGNSKLQKAAGNLQKAVMIMIGKISGAPQLQPQLQHAAAMNSAKATRFNSAKTMRADAQTAAVPPSSNGPSGSGDDGNGGTSGPGGAPGDADADKILAASEAALKAAQEAKPQAPVVNQTITGQPATKPTEGYQRGDASNSSVPASQLRGNQSSDFRRVDPDYNSSEDDGDGSGDIVMLGNDNKQSTMVKKKN